jgi:isopenicillin N synthase-like dioxygenase
MSIELPVLDISRTDNETAARLVDSVSKHGFAYIKNNSAGIPPADVDAMFKLVSDRHHGSSDRGQCLIII